MTVEHESCPDIHFVRITAATVLDICQLSETLSPAHQGMVAGNAVSIAQAHFSENAWAPPSMRTTPRSVSS